MRLGSDGFNKWSVVALLWFVACLNYCDRMSIFAVLPLIKKEMGASDTVLALLGSTFLWCYGICSPLGGYLGDRFSRKKVILCSLVIFSVVTFVTGLARTGTQLITLRVFLGVSEAIFLPAALAHIASFHSSSTRSLANAIALTGLTFGGGLGGFYGGYMGDHYSWRTGFYILGVLGILWGLVVMAFLPEAAVSAENTRVQRTEDLAHEPLGRKLLAILTNRTAACVVFLALAISVASWPIGTWVPTYLYERFGMSLTKSGLTMALFSYIPSLTAALLGGLWADRWAKRNPTGRLSTQVISLGLMAPAVLAMGFMPSGTTLAGNLLVYSLATGIVNVNSMPVFTSVVPVRRWSTAYGVYNLVGTLPGGVGVLLVGVMKARWGIGYGLSATSVPLFLAFALLTYALFRFYPNDIKKLQEETLRENASGGNAPLLASAS